MDNQEQYFEKIDAYHYGRLTQEERVAFEQEIAQNPDLAELVRVFQLEHQATELLQKDQWKERFDRWDKEDEDSPKVIPLRRRIIPIAAAASVLLVIGFAVWSIWNPLQNNEALATSFLDETSMIERSVGTVVPEVLQPGLEALATEDYSQAVELLQQATGTEYEFLAILYTGKAYFKQKDYAAAISTFEGLTSSDAPAMEKEKAEWYLLLSRIAAGESGSQVERLFDKILTNPEHEFYPDAKKINEQMR